MGIGNKKILFLGDSITALNTTERGWVKYFNEIVAPSHFVNVAVSGARLSNSKTPVVFDGNPVFLGDNTDYNQNVVANQIEKIARRKDPTNPHFLHDGDFDDFNYILVAAGTNDYFCKEKCDLDAIEEQFTRDGKVLPLENVNCFTWPGAMRYIYEKLKDFYPNARIYFCSPVEGCETVRPYKEILYKRNLMKAICDRIADVTFIDTFSCGICGKYEKDGENGRDLIDGLHPNVSGAKKIGEYNAAAFTESLA